MKQILDEIDTAIEHDRPVYLHCWGGRGRTGTVVGCWLVRHGKATGDEALAMIQRLRKNDPTSYMPSPETGKQKSMVTSWRIGE